MNSIHGRTSGRKTPIRFGNRIIGEMDDGGPGRRWAVFFVSNRNWYRAANGYSLDAAIVEGLEGQVDAIEFLDKKGRRRETIPYDTFMARAWLTKDYGFGKKYVCDARFYDGKGAPAGSPAVPMVQPDTLLPGLELGQGGEHHASA